MSPGRNRRADELARLHDAVPATYQMKAAAWDVQRGRGFFERGWVERAVAGLPPGAAVLDLGCGAGRPIAEYLIGRGFRLTGLDAAPAMLAIARARFPAARWVVGDMRYAELPPGLDAIIGWDSFFHLNGAEQTALIPRLVAALKPGRRLLLTVGPAESEAVGHVDGAAVYHASLAPDTYRRICHEAGCDAVEIAVEDPACDRHTLLLARKAGPAPAS